MWYLCLFSCTLLLHDSRTLYCECTLKNTYPVQTMHKQKVLLTRHVKHHHCFLILANVVIKIIASKEGILG